MFIRFVTTRVHDSSHRPEGVFAAAYWLLDSGVLGLDEKLQLREILIWFNRNLPHPRRFDADRAVFWFKPAAHESIGKIWELVAFLRLQGFHVEVHKCRRLRNIAYEDRHQVAAFPSVEDGRIRIA